MIDDDQLQVYFNAGKREDLILGYLPRLRQLARDVLKTTRHRGNRTALEDIQDEGARALVVEVDRRLEQREFDSAKHLANSLRQAIVSKMTTAYRKWAGLPTTVEFNEELHSAAACPQDAQKEKFLRLAMDAVFEQASGGEVRVASIISCDGSSVSAASRQCGVKRETARDWMDRLGERVAANSSAELKEAIVDDYEAVWDAAAERGVVRQARKEVRQA